MRTIISVFLAAVRVLSFLLLSSGMLAQAVPLSGKPAKSALLPETPANLEFRKGIEARLKGDFITAKKRFGLALQLDEKFIPAMLGLADLALRQGDKPAAESYLRQAERLAPKAIEVQLAWGRYYQISRQPELAEQALLKAHNQNTNAIAPLLELGDLYLKLGNRKQDAVNILQAAVALEPNNKFAYYGLGVAYISNGQRDAALVALEKAAQLAPKDPAPLRAIGRLHLEAGLADKALNAFERGLERQPRYVPLMLDRADALARMAKWPVAIAQLKVVAAMLPKSAEIQIKLGDAYQGSVNEENARAAYLKAIELDGKNPLPYNNLAWMTVQTKGPSAKALEWARKAVSLSPGSAPFCDTLGWVERAAGDLPAAGNTLRRCTEIDPKSAEFFYHYGVVLAELKKNSEARSTLENALKLNPNFSKAEEARKLLGTL